ncbi:hypothetical protein BaRGS_00029457, partial [Batillaria attramentaria]
MHHQTSVDFRGSLYHDQIIWHRNGVPVEFTDRHFQKVELREVPEDTSLLNKVLRENGISVYEINATLIIHLLKESEFGSYTCHVARRYYNRTTERYELIEIPHPHELVVIPREQDMLNVFVNRSTGKYNPGSVMKSTAPNPCYSGSLFDEMSLAKEFAVVAVNYFEREELIFFAVVASLGLLILWNTRRWLRFM